MRMFTETTTVIDWPRLELRVAAWLQSLSPVTYRLHIARNNCPAEVRTLAQSQDPEAIAAAARLLVQPGDIFMVSGQRGPRIAKKIFYAEGVCDITACALFCLDRVLGALNLEVT
jgi:hypothetical protein